MKCSRPRFLPPAPGATGAARRGHGTARTGSSLGRARRGWWEGREGMERGKEEEEKEEQEAELATGRDGSGYSTQPQNS